jgi:hypothetical protein
MKRIGILVLMYIVGGVSGVVYHSMTTGAADRARIALLDGALKERSQMQITHSQSQNRWTGCRTIVNP